MLIPLAVALLAAGDLAEVAAPGLAALSQKEIRADVRFLADDLLEGRRAGDPGHHVAARYVAARMEALGLRPAGVDGFYQPMRLREVRPDPAASLLTLLDTKGDAAENLRLPEEATVTADPGRETAEAEGEATFVGFGLCTPGPGVAARDLEGRVAVVLGGGPEPAAAAPAPGGATRGRQPAPSDTAAKWRCLAARGAVALVTLRTPAQEAAVPWRVRSGAGRTEVGLAEPSPQTPPISATIDRPAAERLLARAGRRLA